jgi:hypothetical protein
MNHRGRNSTTRGGCSTFPDEYAALGIQALHAENQIKKALHLCQSLGEVVFKLMAPLGPLPSPPTKRRHLGFEPASPHDQILRNRAKEGSSPPLGSTHLRISCLSCSICPSWACSVASCARAAASLLAPTSPSVLVRSSSPRIVSRSSETSRSRSNREACRAAHREYAPSAVYQIKRKPVGVMAADLESAARSR